MHKLDIVLDDGIFECREDDSYACDEICRCCVHGKGVEEVRSLWSQCLLEDPRGYSEALGKLSSEDFASALSYEYCDASNPYSVFGYDPLYQEIARQLPSRYGAVVDFGCSNAMQSVWFDDVAYVGVDDFFLPAYLLPGHGFYPMRAQDFVESGAADKFDPDTTLAICLHVPDAEARQAVAVAFPNNIIVYNGLT